MAQQKKQMKRFQRLAAVLLALMLMACVSPAVFAGAEVRHETASDKFFEHAGAFTMRYEPRERYLYNHQYVPQWLFGFNPLYDAFTFAALCNVDTLRCTFTYQGRDWLIQLWKGAYAGLLATGGEIGVYTKPQGMPAEHYFSAWQDNWLGMEMQIYREGRLLFTRPFAQYWWCTGYQAGYLDGFLTKPRDHCVMAARLQLKNSDMAALFAAQLHSKGFQAIEAPPDPNDGDAYYSNGDSVWFSWRTASESWY